MRNFLSAKAGVGVCYFIGFLFCSAGVDCGAEWPQWGGTPSRNMVSTDAGKLPCWFSPGVADETSQDGIKPGSTANVRWVVNTRGSYASPVVSQRRAIAGDLQCFDLTTGNLLWRGAKDAQGYGYGDTPTIDGDRVYTVTGKGVVLCLDLFADKKGATEGAVLWNYDMKQLGVFLHWVHPSSPLVLGDYVYVGTGNERGISKDVEKYRPLAPSLIVLNKKTGQLVARDDEQIGVRNYGNQWPSPSSGTVNGKTLIFYGGGDGVCYAFEQVDPAMAAKANPGKTILTKLHRQIAYLTDKPTPEAVNTASEQMKQVERATGIPAGEVRCGRAMKLDDVEASVPDVSCLKKIWSCDCNPTEYKVDANSLPVPPSRPYTKPWHPCALQIGSTPVFYNNKVYVAIGCDPNDGPNGGNLVCIDATRKGDMKAGEWLWNYKMNRTASTVCVSDGLLYAIDFYATVYCFNAETGEKYWEYDCIPELKKAPWNPHNASYASPMLANGKIFVATGTKQLFILAAGREPKLLGTVDLDAKVFATPCVVGNTLLLLTEKKLWAVQDKGAVAP